jgi:protein ImuB
MMRLDQALGRAHEALTPRRPAPPVFALRRFLEPVFTADAVLQVTEDLCGDAIAKLDVRGAGVLRAELVLFGVDGRDRVIGMNVSKPLREVKPLMRLFREKLNIVGENLDAEFGFEAARLDVVRLARIDEGARTLVDVAETAASPEKIGAIVDVLSSRLGAKRVVRPQLHEEHAPERAAGWRSALGKANDANTVKPPADGVQRRPVRLFSPGQLIEVMASVPDGPPIRCRWRRVTREVVRAEGPERISGDWQRREMTRDYYRVEDKQGRRYWLYREGLYGESDAIPRWFVHGLFA